MQRYFSKYFYKKYKKSFFKYFDYSAIRYATFNFQQGFSGMIEIDELNRFLFEQKIKQEDFIEWLQLNMEKEINNVK